MTSRKLAPKTARLLEASLEATHDLGLHEFARWVVVAQALSEYGFRAQALYIGVALNPEHWQRPSYVEAIKINGVITNGKGDYGWDALIEKEREREDIEGGYVDRVSTTIVEFEGLKTLNLTNTTFIYGMNEALARAKSAIEQCKLKDTTPKPTLQPRRRGL